MPEISTNQLEMLAMIIQRNIKAEFADKKMSGNLIHTIQITEDSEGIHIFIPAQMYNMKKFQLEGVVIHTSNGSYAEKLDEEGSEFYIYSDKGYRFKAKPHNHKGFIEDVIDKSIKEWVAALGIDVAKREISQY